MPRKVAYELRAANPRAPGLPPVPAEIGKLFRPPLPLTAKWLPPCVSLSKIGDGPNALGDKLRYVFKQGGRQSEMAGEILARVLGERLHCQYSDSAFDVSVDLRVAPAPGGALTTHIIEICPKTLLGKLMWPLIRLGLGKQTRDAAANLKKLLEANPAK